MKKSILFLFTLVLSLASQAQEDVQSFEALDRAPIYLGCDGDNTELKNCLSQKIAEFVGENYNQEYAEGLGIPLGSYRMLARFKIDTEGDFVEVNVQGEHEELNEELKRVITAFPKVVPGMIDGERVNVLYALPVQIQINEPPYKKKKKGKKKN